MSVNKNQTISSVIWRFLERFSAQGVAFVVSVILARILGPEEYGLVAIVTVYITLMQVFIDGGFGNALIQKKNADDLDFSTVFYFNIALCLVLYIIMFFCAPFIANIYGENMLTPVIRVQSILIIISAIKNVQVAYLSKQMMFKKFFFATLGGTVGAAVVGIGMALAGFGVWALVAQSLFNNIMGTTILWFIAKWRPKLIFSFSRLKTLFDFGWKIFVVNVLNVLYANIRQLIVGTKFSSTDLAYYDRGESITKMIISNAVTSVEDVAFPLTSNNQDNKTEIKKITKKMIKSSVFISFPMLMGLVGVSHNLISVVFTDKWLPAVPYLQIFCMTYMFYPIHVLSLNVIKAVGKSDIYLKLEIIKKVSEVVVIFIAMQYGAIELALSSLIFTIITLPLDLKPNGKLINYPFKECIKDISPTFVISLIMGGVVYLVGFITMNKILLLVIQVIVGVVVYVVLSVIFQREMMKSFVSLIKKK